MSVVLEKELPKGWIITTLPFIVKNERYAIKRGPFGSHLKKQFFVESGYKVYEQQHVIKNNFSLGDYYIEEKKFQELKNFVIKAGDVLISCSGTVGEIAIVPKEFEKGIINQALLKISLDPLIVETKFFISLFIFWMLKARIDSHGSSMRNLSSVKELKKLPISLPPLNEQKRIVAKIEELFSLVDSAKENLEKTKLLLKQYRQSILKHAFEGKLTEEWRAGNKKIIEKEKKAQKEISLEVEDLKRKTRQEFGTLYGNELFEIPDEWIWARFVNVAKIGQGGTPSTAMKEYWNGDIPWLRSGNVRNNFITASNVFITKLGLQNSSTTLCSQGTVLLAMTGQGLTRGRSAVLEINACANQSVAHIITNNKRIFNKFLFYYLQSQYWKIRSVYKGSNQPGLNVSIIKQFEIPIPSIPEQVLIVQKIEESFSIIEKNEKLVDTLLQQFYQMKNSILKQAFEGRLVPQDPNDEPAQILLERIQQERKKNGK